MKKLIFLCLINLLIISCDKDSKCNSCGDIGGGLVTMKVNEQDLSRYEGLAQIKGVTVGSCIQAYIFNEDLFLNTVIVLDACCCEY